MTARSPAFEQLESRRLMAVTITGPLDPTFAAPGSGPTTIDLSSAFDDPDLDTLVRFDTSQGNVDIRLLDRQKPRTVANFLNYVRGGRYNGTIVHRSDSLTGTPGAPSDIIQGGGFAFPGFGEIATDPPIRNEFTKNGVRSNVRGTIAMAKTSDPNSATSQWFINLTDNSQALDDRRNSGGFTVFGDVLPAALPAADAIGGLPRFNFGGPFAALPVRNYTQTDYQNQVMPGANNVVLINSAGVLPDFSYTVTSSNPALVTPTVTGSNLTLTYGAGAGSATITVTAAGEGGQTASQTFVAGVGELTLTLNNARGGRKSVTFTDGDGTQATVAVGGAGEAAVRLVGTGLTQTASGRGVTVGGTVTQVGSITLTGSGASTSLSVKGSGGDGLVEAAGFTADAGLKALAGRGLNLSGGATIGGAARAVQLGRLSGGTFAVGDTLGSLKVSEAISGTTVRTTGNIGSVSAGAITDSRIYAGVAGTGTELPDDIGDFTGVSSINSVNTRTFSNSNLAAAALQRLSLGAVDTDNAGTSFGIAGGVITSLTGTLDPGGQRFRFRNLAEQADFDAQLAEQGLNLGNFLVRVV
jgi:cyclophilin family peptidyl-prolyl cis-trans isomerase